MSGFADPIVGGSGNLIRQQIQSPNFNLAAKTGWAILKNGNAYFFNVTATGTITSTTVVVQGATGGVFIYSGVPANGNLIIAIAGQAGTDSFGNSYSQGFSGGAPGSNKQVVVGINGGSPLIFFLSAIATAFNNAAFMLNVNGAGTAAADSLVLKSSQDNAFKDYVAINLNGNSNDGTTALATLLDAYVDTGGTAHFYRTLGAFGATLIGSLTGVQPGTGTGRSNIAVAETWHTMSLATHFTSNAGDQAPRYRFEGLAGGVCKLDGVIYTDGTAIASGTTITTLPVGYRPQQRKRFATVNNVAASTVDGATFIANTNGTITTSVAIAAAVNQIVLEGIQFPVD